MGGFSREDRNLVVGAGPDIGYPRQRIARLVLDAGQGGVGWGGVGTCL
jgi:hypothetical protein